MDFGPLICARRTPPNSGILWNWMARPAKSSRPWKVLDTAEEFVRSFEHLANRRDGVSNGWARDNYRGLLWRGSLSARGRHAGQGPEYGVT